MISVSCAFLSLWEFPELGKNENYVTAAAATLLASLPRSTVYAFSLEIFNVTPRRARPVVGE